MTNQSPATTSAVGTVQPSIEAASARSWPRSPPELGSRPKPIISTWMPNRISTSSAGNPASRIADRVLFCQMWVLRPTA
ncbi:hypothetical protein D3C80_1636890 [compost metagenome]